MNNQEAENLLSRNKSVFQHDEEMTKAVDLAIKALQNERPHGKWVHNGITIDGFDTYCCSICGRHIVVFSSLLQSKYPFCNCGADMRGDTK